MNRIAGAPISLGRVRSAGLGLPAAARPGARRDAGGGARRHRAGPRRVPARRAGRDGARPRRAPPAGHRRVHPDPVARGGPRPGSRRARAAVDVRRDRVRPCWCSPPTRGRPATTPGPSSTTTGWQRLLRNLDRDRRRRRRARHPAQFCTPHVGTWSSPAPEVMRVLDGASIPLCLDTGHLLIGGTDPAELTGQVPDRVAHADLKDVDLAFAKRSRTAGFTYTDGVRDGMYRPLGKGDVDVRDRRSTRRERGTTAGTPSSRTRSSPSRRPARGRSPTSATAWIPPRAAGRLALTTSGSRRRSAGPAHLQGRGEQVQPARAAADRRCGPPGRGRRACPARRRRCRRW